MLKQLIKKLLGFLAVAIGGKDYSVLREGNKAPNEAALPVIDGVVIGKDITTVAGTEAYVIYLVYGRHVYVGYEQTRENGITTSVSDIAGARYVNFTEDRVNRTPRNQPTHHIEWIDEPLSEKTFRALVADHEYDLKRDREKATTGKPVTFIHKAILPPDPAHPKEAAATPQATTDHPHP
jgi:hypothetical protein